MIKLGSSKCVVGQARGLGGGIRRAIWRNRQAGAIHFISGKPGGGKSMYALKLVIEELLYGRRMIITNLPIKVGELNAYLQAQYPGRSVDVVGRVWILTDEQTQYFWLYRPNGVRLKNLSPAEWKEGLKPDYSAVRDEGVFYVIDEIHNFFGARQWALTGQDVLFYLSQHRKLGDTVVCVTQAINNVDKQFRSVSQDFTFLRNLSKEQYGMFRLPAIFLRKTFTSPPTETSQPMESGSFRLDTRGLGQCYDSAAGVGIHGRGADMGEKRKGTHYVFFFVGVAALCLLVFGCLPKMAAKYFDNTGKTLLAAPKVSVVAHSSQAMSTNSSPPALTNGWGSMAAAGVASPVVSTNVYMTGCASLGGGAWAILLSDGRSYQLPRDRAAVQSFSRYGCVIEGVHYRMRF